MVFPVSPMREQINPIPQQFTLVYKDTVFQTIVENRSAGSIEPEGEINEEDFANAKNKDAGFRGAGDVIRLIEELLTFERVLTDEIEFYEQVVMGILEAIENDTRTGRGATNPANILFNTIISFTPAKGDKKAVIERGEMYGHFLTPAYYEFRKDKAKRKEVNYDMPKPPKSWSNLKPNKAKPPMWLSPVRPKRWVEDSPSRYYRHSQANHRSFTIRERSGYI